MSSLILLFFTASVASIFPSVHGASSPTPGNIVKLDYGSFQGAEDTRLTKFLGMPFAAPPVGNLRFAPPQNPISFDGIRNATSFGLACPQQAFGLPVLSTLGLPDELVARFNHPPIPASEDCLFINVVKPSSAGEHSKLPVIFWIFGGGFEIGDSSSTPGDSVVNRSIDLNEPVIYVSINYRQNAFGFLGGKEALEAGAANAGLKDQRFALEWVQKYIHLFGGDPTKVIIWGESAGAISVALNLVINNGHADNLFRGAIMQSGSVLPLRSTTDYQPVYDQLVSDTGCTGTNDTIACLRAVPEDQLIAAVNNTAGILSYQSLVLSYEPSIDGEFITRSPVESVKNGLYAKVPIIHGDADDEGTMFALTSLNVTTDSEFRDYISTVYFPGITTEQLDAISKAYPSSTAAGSPFDTGNNSALTPEYKRIAAFEGDLVFQAPRRLLMAAACKTQPTYGFLYKRQKDIPFLGSFHGSDLADFYGIATDFIVVDALINFINTLDPNLAKNHTKSATYWPRYTSEEKMLLSFIDPAPAVNLTKDDYRESGMELLMKIAEQIPI